MPFMSWPDANDFVLRSAHVPTCLTAIGGEHELQSCDIHVRAGLIHAVAPSLPPAEISIDLADSIVIPGFVDLHTHLDKGHIWPRIANQDGTHLSAQQAVKSDRELNWTAEDVYTRASFGLRCAYSHGTIAVRTHLDSLGAQLAITWPVFCRLRDE